MNNLKDEIRSLLLSDQRVKSFHDLKPHQKKSLSIESLENSDFDVADILLYRDDTFKVILSKYLNGTMTGEQCMTRILDVLVKGVSNTMDELIDDERAEIAFEERCHSRANLEHIRNG
ncbi:MAG TPA: hypothetical protein PLF59_08275 [Cyclobacteriaceae bacterium]|nr:hypothetical protein [Cyclobacteriaceae bacterium]